MISIARRRIPLLTEDEYEYVDLGLPSGLLWAKCNIGAETETDTGLYFQWGDTQGYTADQVGSGEGKKYFGWVDYKYGNGKSSPGKKGMTKYNDADSLKTLEASDDAAKIYMGANWRMPTNDEYSELNEYINHTFVNNYNGSGKSGRLFISKKDSSKSIFFPRAFYCYNGSFDIGGYSGCWTSTCIYDDVRKSRFMSVYNGNFDMTDGYRCYGFPVRAVRSA